MKHFCVQILNSKLFWTFNPEKKLTELGLESATFRTWDDLFTT